MDLKAFYQKMRQVEETLLDRDVVIISLETPEGGRAGVPTEVPRTLAARMVVEGRARVATPEETAEFREKTAEAARAAEQVAAASRMHVTVISDADLRAIKGTVKKS